MAKRTGTMADRQGIEVLLRCKKSDQVPNWPFAPMGFGTVYVKTSSADAYNKPEVALVAQGKTG